MESGTVQAAIVAGLLGILTLLRACGIDFIDLDEGNLTEIVSAFAIIISAGVAVWRRIKAKTTLT